MKKARRIIAWIAGLIVVLIILLVVAVELFFPTERARQWAVEKGTEALGRDITIEGVDVSIWGGIGVVLQDVTIANPDGFDADPLLSTERLDVKLQFFPLLAGDFALDRLIIDEPLILLLKRADGSTNYTFETFEEQAPAGADKLPAEAQPAAAAISFDRLEINDGVLRYIDDSSMIRATLHRFDLNTGLSNPREGVFTSRGRLSVDSLTAMYEDDYGPFAIGLDYAAEFDMNGRTIRIDETQFRFNGLAVDVSGDASLTEPMKGHATLTSGTITVAELTQLLPPSKRELLADYNIEGTFSLNATADYDASLEVPLDYAATAEMSEVAVSSAQVPGELTLARAVLDVKPDNVRFNIQQGSFDGEPLKGHFTLVNFEQPSVDGELSGSLNLSYAEPFLPTEGRHRVSGRTTFDIKIQGPLDSLEHLNVSGDVAVRNGTYNSNLLPEPIDTLELDVYFDRSVARIRNLKASMPSGDVAFEGRITDLLPWLMADSLAAMQLAPGIDGTLKGDVDMALANPFLPEKGAPEMSGRLAVDLQLAGNINRVSSFQPRGSIVVKNGSYRDSLLAEPITSLEAALRITPDTIYISRLDVAFESSDVSLTGRMLYPFPYLLPIETNERNNARRPMVFVTASATRFNVDKLFPEAVPGAGGAEQTEVDPDSISSVMLPDIDARGSFSADTVVYMGVDFTDVSGKVTYADRTIDAYDVSGMVYSGDVNGKTTIDLSDMSRPRYVGEFDANRIEANDFMTRFTPFGGHLFGKFNFSGDYDAAGWDPDVFLQSLSVDGNAAMREGQVVTSGVVYQSINSLAQKIGEEFDKEQALRDVATKVKVEDGRVRVDDITADLGSLGMVTFSGSYGFDEAIEYSGTIRLNEETSAKLAGSSGLLKGVTELFGKGGAGGTTLELPIVIGGTLTKPTFTINYDALAEQGKENLVEDAADKLKNLFKK